MALLPSCLADPPSLSPPRVFPSHPFAHIGSELLRPAPWADPTARLAGSLSARLRRSPRRWLRPSAPRLWWSPPDWPAVSSAAARGRRVHPGRRPLAYGEPQERTPSSQCPVRHRQGSGRYGTAGTGNRGATLPPRPPRSGPVWSVVPDNALCGHNYRRWSAGLPLGLGTAAVWSGPLPQHGAWRSAPASRWPPVPDVPPGGGR